MNFNSEIINVKWCVYVIVNCLFGVLLKKLIDLDQKKKKKDECHVIDLNNRAVFLGFHQLDKTNTNLRFNIEQDEVSHWFHTKSKDSLQTLRSYRSI